ncbi:MAG: hypothetical protein IJJ72_06560 [Bacteroidales bacterium]|nr:hypothetical protein [Bacteroidales bacterium]
MKKGKKESFFWTSYSDLMTSLFFVMLVLFILAISIQHGQLKDVIEQNQHLTELINKGQEIEKSIQHIDNRYFEYDSLFKRHTLKDINISFRTGSDNIDDISIEDKQKLIEAGKAIRDFMIAAKQDTLTLNADYLLIVEGQSSKDGWVANYELSYARALALVKYWSRNRIVFDDLPCEVIISGSGQASKFRIQPDNQSNKKNQRFVIHIIPKPGVLSSADSLTTSILKVQKRRQPRFKRKVE